MVVNSFHARSGSSTQLDTGDVHVCHICLKQFSRRDLRERHRRRCEKSIGKIIPTKKRSCERCISFKVKCDYEKPSCSRCLNRSVPCEYKLEPRVKMPLNPAFSLGPNTAFSGSLDVFSVQDGMPKAELGHAMLDTQQHHHHHHQHHQQPQHQHQQHHHHQHLGGQHQSQHHHAHHQQQHHHSSHMPPLTATEMAFDLSSSTASTDVSLDGSLDMAGHGGAFYSNNEYYQHWSQDGGSASSSSNGQSSQWDATTVWSDGSSNLLDPIMLDDAVIDSTWAANLMDPTMCMDNYQQSCVFYGQEYQQAAVHNRSGKRIGKSASLSY